MDKLPFTLALAGDVMLGRMVNDALADGPPERVWGDVLPVLRTADLFLANLECALTARTERWTDGAYRPFYFRADPAKGVAALRAGRLDAVLVANNHIADFGLGGMADTLAALDGSGIAHAGAGADSAAARAPARLSVGRTRVSVVGFADYPVEWRAGSSSPGLNYTPISLGAGDFGEVARQIAAARDGADLLVFSIHWGPNMRAWPSPQFRAFAHAVIDAGADIFWGHSAHVVQGIEYHNGRPILYDTGDLVDDYAVDPHLRNDLSALFLLRVRPPVVEEIQVVPVRIADLRVSLAGGGERDWFLKRLAVRCAELGTSTAEAPGMGRIHVARLDPHGTRHLSRAPSGS